MSNKENALMTQATAKPTAMNVFSDAKNFEVALRMADCLAHSTVVPKDYQGNVGNCMIAIEMASRINTSPMMVMQNLYIVNGRPAWSSQWIIAMINSSRRFKTELQFEFGKAPEDGGLSCYAYAEDYQGHIVKGPKITMTMANSEGWTSKNGSKWKTMPEVMIQYRAASFFGRMNCPDMIMGIYSQEEVIDMGPVIDAGIDGYTLNQETGELEPTGDEPDPEITQDERRELFAMAHTAFGKEQGNALILEILKEYGLNSTTGMTISTYTKVKADLEKVINDAKQQPADLPAPEQQEPTGK